MARRGPLKTGDPLSMLWEAIALLSGNSCQTARNWSEFANANCMFSLRYILSGTNSGILSSNYDDRWKFLTRNGPVAYPTAVFNSGIWFAFNAMRTLILGIGAAVALGFGWFAFEAGSIGGLVSACGIVVLLGLAFWLIWRPVSEANPTVQQGLESLQRQVKTNNLKQLWSGIGAVFGALVILLIGLLVFFNGSIFAGLLFFCSGAMAMRAAWTLLWGQRGARGKER